MDETRFRNVVVVLLGIIAITQVLAYVAPTESARADDPKDVRIVDWRVYGRTVDVRVVESK